MPPALPATLNDYLPAGFAFSCLGFLFFLSFFWEWLPLPMAHFLAALGGGDTKPGRSLATAGRFGQPGFPAPEYESYGTRVPEICVPSWLVPE